MTRNPDPGSDDWHTPPEIVELVLKVWPDMPDLDPATSEAAIVPALRRITPESDGGIGGLEADWGDAGRVWLNPPYSRPAPWLRKLRDHVAQELDPTNYRSRESHLMEHDRIDSRQMTIAASDEDRGLDKLPWGQRQALALIKADTSTRIWHEIAFPKSPPLGLAPDVLWFRKRIRFVGPRSKQGKGSPNFASAMLVWGPGAWDAGFAASRASTFRDHVASIFRDLAHRTHGENT